MEAYNGVSLRRGKLIVDVAQTVGEEVK